MTPGAQHLVDVCAARVLEPRGVPEVGTVVWTEGDATGAAVTAAVTAPAFWINFRREGAGCSGEFWFSLMDLAVFGVVLNLGRELASGAWKVKDA